MRDDRVLPAADRSIRAANYRGSGRETEYRVHGIDGLVLAIQAPKLNGTSTKSWRVYYSATGQTGERTIRKKALGRYPAISLAQARLAALGVRSQVEMGVDVVAAERAARAEAERHQLTLADLIEDYIAEHAAAAKPIATLGELARVLRRDIAGPLGHIRPQELTDYDVECCIAAIATRSPATAQHALAYLVRVYNHLILRSAALRRRYGNIRHNPAELVSRSGRFRLDGRRDRALDDDEIVSFWRAIDVAPLYPATRDVMKVLLLTGARRNEVRLLSVHELKLAPDARRWELPPERIKSRRLHVLPITDPVFEILSPHIARRTKGFVFRGPNNDVIKEYTCGQVIRRLHERGQLPIAHFTIHDLRRTVETGMARLRIPKELRDKCLGHVDGSVGAQRYDRHDYFDEKREALEKWAAHVMRLVAQ